jgi:integrase
MPRKVRDSNLETRTARSRLSVRHKPYFRLIEPGLHLGYRKLKSGPGTWIVRRYVGEGRYSVRNLTTVDELLIVADDFSDADGSSVLTFAQAQERAKAYRPAATDNAGPHTVEMAMDDYIAFLEESRLTADDARYRDRAFIREAFGRTELEKLTTSKIRAWVTKLASEPPRLRTRKGEVQKHRELSNDEEAKRRRQASANRTLTVFKAALNRAWRDGKVSTDLAWRRVQPFHSVDAARIRYLTVAEAKRLLNTCAVDFRKIVRAALQTGARYGQLARLVASDFSPDNGTVRLQTRKGRGKVKVYHAVLNAEGVRFFAEACAGLGTSDVIFRKNDGTAWGKSHQKRLMCDACERAKIYPPIGFHILRHTWASHAVMNGVPLLVVAKNLGHSDTRMVEKHYGHLAPSYIVDAIRAGAPRFGFKPDPKIATLPAKG